MIKRIKAKCKNKNSFKLSVPCFVYVGIFVLCIFLIVAKVVFDGLAAEIAANIGYSLFASNVAGILFDLGTNISNDKKAKKQFGAVCNSHKQLLYDIVVIADYTCKKLNIDGYIDMSCKEQLESVLYKEIDSDYIISNDYYESIEDIYYWLELVRDNSEKLINISYIMHDNKYFNEKKRMTFKLLSAIADKAIALSASHSIENNKEICRLIEDVIIVMLLKLYPEEKSLFSDEV